MDWSHVIILVIGAAIPVFTLWVKSKEKQKYFELEIKEKMKLVAVEKRLEAHQKALKVWYDLKNIIFSKSGNIFNKVINEAYNFWYENAIYLEKNTRRDFHTAIKIVVFYQQQVEMAKDERDPVEKKKMIADYKKDWDFFHKVFDTIQEEVMLIPIHAEPDTNPEGEKTDG